MKLFIPPNPAAVFVSTPIKNASTVGDHEKDAVSRTAGTLPVWKTAAVLLARSCSGGYGM